MRSQVVYRVVVAASLGLAATCATASADAVRLTCGSAPQTLDVPARRRDGSGGELRLETEAELRPAVLVVEETGRDVEWREPGAPEFRDVASRPPRFGVAAWNVDQPRALTLRARDNLRAVRVSAWLSCRPTVEVAALPVCLAAPDFWSGVPSEGLSGWCDALSRHSTATSIARRGDNALALSHYGRAAALWHERKDSVREGAALLGAAEILWRMDRYDDALAQATQASQLSRAAGNEYFALRAQGEICLSLRELGRRDDARQCQSTLARDFSRIGETADAANAYVSLGSMAQDDGQTAAARVSLAALDTLDLSQAPPDIAPRARLLRAGVDMQDGRVAGALEHLELAATQFEQIGSTRWLGNTQLQIAGIYAQLGAVDESRHFAGAALSIFSARHSPARRALAFRVLGIAEAAENADEKAAAHFSQARQLLAGIPSPRDLFFLDIAEAAARRDEAALQRASIAVAEGIQPTSRQRARLQLLRAWRAFRADDHAAANSLVATMAADELPFADYFQLRTLQARLLVTEGNSSGGFSLLNDDIDRLHGIVAVVESPALRYIAGKRLGELRAAWTDAYAHTRIAERPDPAALWLMLQKTQRLRLMSGGSGGGPEANDVDRRLAQLFLQPDDGDGNRTLKSQRDLLRFYLQPRSRRMSAAANPMSLQQLQELLPPGARLIAFAFGDEQSITLSVTRQDVTVGPPGSASLVRDATRRLRSGLASTAAVSQIESEVAELSRLLFSGEKGPAPGRLFLMSDGELGGVPVSFLTWPDGGVLLDSTAVSLIAGALDADSFQSLPLPPRFHVLTSSLPGSRDGRLPPLAAADLDIRPLRHALPAADFVVNSDAQFTRQRLLDALASPGSWVHVAAHGSNEARLQGYSGLWIASSPENAPALVSWLEISERGVQSDLLVLSSCNLGGSPERNVSGATSFAAAMSAAGARNVVAALWPVSDMAAAQFDRTFYTALLKSKQPDVAQAVAAAQRELRKNPHFRHPYYWSLFVHLQR